ncbi:DUF4314 domain-containing protein [Lapidilactobacillus luobeiensis]|uniref:DUF4314 domain-containing protein n=1 Tax=Lapidilactobacillus luobeiensis TaxID=2950371 RepID=UPI0021C4989B|nr:DUF4314 domain-containing protein [Lapidilactobacillus luobeiensis]
MTWPTTKKSRGRFCSAIFPATVRGKVVRLIQFPNEETVNHVRRKYPVGCRVELVRMNDEFAPPIGTLGTVWAVDDSASVSRSNHCKPFDFRI